MLFSHLHMIIDFLQKQVPCPNCSEVYDTNLIDIVDIYDEGAVIILECGECGTEVEVEIQIRDGELTPNITILNEDAVSEEDVERITKALAGHKGGLKSLFKEEEL